MKMIGKRIHQSELAVVMPELAISILVVVFLLLSGIEALRVSYVALSLQWGVTRAARYASLGHTEQTCGPSADQACSREESIRIEFSKAFGRNIPASELLICSNPIDTYCPPSPALPNAGNPNEWVALNVNHPVSLAFGNYTLTLKASAITKNEPRFS